MKNLNKLKKMKKMKKMRNKSKTNDKIKKKWKI